MPAIKAALVYGQMNEPPGARARVALTGLTVAEYFRDEEGQDGTSNPGRGPFVSSFHHPYWANAAGFANPSN